MSESKKELLKPAILAVIAASLLGTVVYYFIPQGPPFSMVAFALGRNTQVSGDYSTLFVHGLGFNVTFLNGSTIPVYTIFPMDEQGEVNFPEVYNGEINATDLEKITIYVTEGVGMYDRGSLKFIVGCVQNRTINVDLLMDEGIVDMGSSKTVGDTWRASFGDVPREELSEFPLNVTLKESTSTGYWATTDFVWEIGVQQLGDILHNSSTANVTFALDASMCLKYKVVTSEGNVTGDAELQWSGTWGTLQLLHEGDEVLLVRYSFSNIKLNMIVA